MITNSSKTPDDLTFFPAGPESGAAHGKRPLNICIASPEFIGPIPHGGTGIAYTAMAQALAAAGHKVTCLFLGIRGSSDSAWKHWVDKYERDGLTLIALPAINASFLMAPTNLIKSYETYHWLKRNDHFDIIHFPERQGAGYHTLMAKHHGMAFGRAMVCVGLHSMSQWLKSPDLEPENDLTEVDTAFMERRAVAMADKVVSQSHYLLDWISNQQGETSRQSGIEAHEIVRAAAHALSVDPTDVVALKVMARIHLNAGLHEAAQEACQLILNQDAKDAEALLMSEEALVQEVKLAENLLDSRRPEPSQSFAAGLIAPLAHS